MKLRHLAVLGAIALAGCVPPVPPAPPAPVDPPAESNPDVAPPGQDQEQYSRQDAAGQACMVLQYLQCPEATDSCASDVRKLVILGTFKEINVTCIRQSRTVERVRTCQVEC